MLDYGADVRATVVEITLVFLKNSPLALIKGTFYSKKTKVTLKLEGLLTEIAIDLLVIVGK